jgi:hypothetical protein
MAPLLERNLNSARYFGRARASILSIVYHKSSNFQELLPECVHLLIGGRLFFTHPIELGVYGTKQAQSLLVLEQPASSRLCLVDSEFDSEVKGNLRLGDAHYLSDLHFR